MEKQGECSVMYSTGTHAGRPCIGIDPRNTVLVLTYVSFLHPNPTDDFSLLSLTQPALRTIQIETRGGISRTRASKLIQGCILERQNLAFLELVLSLQTTNATNYCNNYQCQMSIQIFFCFQEGSGVQCSWCAIRFLQGRESTTSTSQ